MNLLNRIRARIYREVYDRRFKFIPHRREISHQDLINEFKKEIPYKYKWPNDNVVAVCISYDDISLMDGTLGSFDCGGELEGKAWVLFNRFLEQNLDLKHTLFFVPHPIYYKDGLTSKVNIQDKFKVRSNSSMIHRLKDLLEQGTVEVALHGLHHHQTMCKHYHTAQEFEFLDSVAAGDVIRKGKILLNSVGIDTYGFKPPAWGIGHRRNFGLLKALQSNSSFLYQCLSSPTNGLNLMTKNASHIWPSYFESLFNIPQNISVFWPEEIWKKIIKSVIDKGGLINIQTHFIYREDNYPDGISKATLDNIIRMIEYINQLTKSKVWHCTHAELATYIRKSK